MEKFSCSGPLWREFTSHRWIPHTKASDVELWCFLWSAPWIKGWVNSREAGDLRCHCAHYDVIVMCGQNQHYAFYDKKLMKTHLESLLNLILSFSVSVWTECGHNKMAATLQTTFFNALSRRKIAIFWCKISLKFAPEGPWTISLLWFS